MCGKELLQLFPNSPQSSTCRCTAARSSADRYSSCTHSHARQSGARRGLETIEAVHSSGGRRGLRGTHRLQHDLACGIDDAKVILRRIDRPFDAKHRPQPPRLCKHRFGAVPEPPQLASQRQKKTNQKISAHSAGFEPARGDPKRFLVSRLNRSATSAEPLTEANRCGKDQRGDGEYGSQ